MMGNYCSKGIARQEMRGNDGKTGNGCESLKGAMTMCSAFNGGTILPLPFFPATDPSDCKIFRAGTSSTKPVETTLHNGALIMVGISRYHRNTNKLSVSSSLKTLTMNVAPRAAVVAAAASWVGAQIKKCNNS
ncbi:hypothetical protein Y1Q_0005620 [Alligator mississippiensis]|uniref:Uncharacterized protein n=1 Tax=Alligator mississippiensis TaxID=8496 RepID=A0A151MF99_ALLMI|nr:hypothetical protein Y1Q_0005620 [Alligator mississippiensis]